MARNVLTINSIDYDSNTTLSEADNFLAIDPVYGAAWVAETDASTRSSFLVAATRRLDLLAWSLDLDTETIPAAVINATALLAAEIQADPTKALEGSSANLTKKIKAGGVEKENFRSEDGVVPLQSKTVYKMILPYLTAGQELTADPCGNPGSQLTLFTDPQSGFGLNGGYG